MLYKKNKITAETDAARKKIKLTLLLRVKIKEMMIRKDKVVGIKRLNNGIFC
jgi:hypothetical protein